MHTNGFASVNGTRLYYEINGEGETVVLLHSGYTDLRLWDNQFETFGKYFKVIRYDIRGFGRSDRPDKPFVHYEDLKGLLDYLEISRTHLVGVSMGGSIAIDFTLKYPNYVKSLVLSGPSLNGYSAVVDEASLKRSKAGLSIVKRDKDFDQSIDFMLKDPMWRQSNLKDHQRLKDMFMDTSLEWILDNLVQTAYPPAAERLCEITEKTLLIVGSEDSKTILEIAGVLESQIAKLRRVDIDGTGHLPNLDKPEEFNKIVLDFLL